MWLLSMYFAKYKLLLDGCGDWFQMFHGVICTYIFTKFPRDSASRTLRVPMKFLWKNHSFSCVILSERIHYLLNITKYHHLVFVIKLNNKYIGFCLPLQ